MNISFIQIVLLRYTSTRTRFVLSFLSGSRTIVVRNIIPVWMSLYHITIVNSSCAIELLKAIFCVPCIIFIKSPSFTLNRFRRQALTPYIWFIQGNHWSPFKDIFPLRLWLPPLAIKWSTSQDSRVYSLWVRAFLHRLIQSMWFFFVTTFSSVWDILVSPTCQKILNCQTFTIFCQHNDRIDLF